MQVPIRWVLVRDPEDEKEPQAFLCTDLDADPVDILRWFVRRWRVETTFEEARRHVGLETQRQWSDQAILRTTPALLGLISLVTLWATQLEAAQGQRRPSHGDGVAARGRARPASGLVHEEDARRHRLSRAARRFDDGRRPAARGGAPHADGRSFLWLARFDRLVSR